MDDAMIENCASRLRKAALACGIPQIVCRFARGVPGGVLAILLWGAAPAQAEIFRVADMVRGVLITQAQCADIQNAVWVTAMGESVCMRYYLSTAGGMGPYPVIFMQGDKFGRYDRATNTFERAGEYKDVDSRSLQRIADSYSLATGTTGIYLARVGVDGSSGHHGIKDTVLEVNLTNAALDAIKQRYRFGGFNLTGQSGGSTNIGGLLALRTDIRCAVPGSGRLALPQAKLLHDRPLDVINPVNYVETIARNSRARILVLTDYQDQHVPADHLLRRCCGRAARSSSSSFARPTRDTTTWHRTLIRPSSAACTAPVTRTSLPRYARSTTDSLSVKAGLRGNAAQW